MITSKKAFIISIAAFFMHNSFINAHSVGTDHHPEEESPFIRDLCKDEKHAIYNNIAAYLDHFSHQPTFLFAKNDPAWQELDGDDLIKKLDRTALGVGAGEFQRLMQPIIDKDELILRTAILQELENPQVFKELDATIHALQDLENNLLHHFDSQSSALNSLFGKGFVESVFEWMGLPAAAALAKEIFTFRTSFYMSIASTGWFLYGLNKERGHISHDYKDLTGQKIPTFADLKEGTVQHLVNPRASVLSARDGMQAAAQKARTLGTNAFENVKNSAQQAKIALSSRESAQQALGQIPATIGDAAVSAGKKVYSATSFGVNSLWMATNLGMFAFSAFSLYGSIANQWKIMATVDNHILAMAQAILYLNKLDNLMQSSPLLAKTPAAKALRSFFNDKTRSPIMRELLEFLINRFIIETRYGVQSTTQRYWLMPSSMWAYDMLQQTKLYLAPVLKAVGTIDAYLSVVRLKKEYTALGIPTTYAQLNDQDEVILIDAHNPLVDPQHSVANSFGFGITQGRHAIFTGPHGCGKTTAMKTIATSEMLNQSTRLIFAKEAKLPIVTKLVTYFNIVDNLSEGVSSFMAEEQRMIELQEAINDLKSTDLLQIFCDEPYAKTIQLIGEDRVCKFGSMIAPLTNVRLFLATHFEKPALLEAETQGVIKNYQPGLNEPELGEFDPTYKIEEGAAQWWFNDAEKRERFITWLGKKVSKQRKPRIQEHAEDNLTALLAQAFGA
jgi:hypothetical protein